MKTKFKYLAIFFACLMINLTTSGCSTGELSQDLQSIQESIQLLKDINEVQKVMALHEFYLSAEMHCEELESIWAQKTPGVSFSQNQGTRVGMESIRKYYCDASNAARKRGLEEMIKRFPDKVKNVPENLGMGSMSIHTLATPIIEVAGDGKTAKGMWYSPGLMTSFGATNSGSWMWEKYAVDFVKEDGKWKIWHFSVYTDFSTPYEKSWVESSLEMEKTGTSQSGGQTGGVFGEPDLPGLDYKNYSIFTVPKLAPKPPEHYYTFSETFSYGPEENP